jgi:hypothetical protein
VTRLERRGRDKHSDLLCSSVNCSRKKGYNIGPRCERYKTFSKISSCVFQASLIFASKTETYPTLRVGSGITLEY